MNNIFINFKNKIMSIITELIEAIKDNKKISIIIGAVVLIIIILLIIFGGKKANNLSGNLFNSGFSVSSGKTIYFLGYNNGMEDGIYKIKGKKKQKIADDYGYYLNIYGNHIFYIDSKDSNIVKLKTNGKDRKVLVENVDMKEITISGKYLYYFDDSYLYRINVNGENKKRILDKTLDYYQIVGNYIYYSYIDNGSYSISKVKIDGENNEKISEECGKSFWVNGNDIYYMYLNKKTENSSFMYELYKIGTNGKNKKKITEISDKLEPYTINFYNKMVYYTKRDDSGKIAIYKMDLKGKKETKVVDINGYATNINLHNDYVYYPDQNENGDIQIYRIKTNGKNKEGI